MLVVGALGIAACGANDDNDESLPEGTGAIVAAITTVPDDVRCVEIYTSDSRSSFVRADVTPGASATIRIAPLSPGFIYLSGAAYAQSCFSDAGFGSDAGVGTTQTWEADPTYAYVEAGRSNEAQLNFHRFASLNVDVNFDEPCCNEGTADGGAPCGCLDAGLDSGPHADAGVPADAGASVDAGHW